MILTELKEIQTIEWSELTTAIDDPKLLVDGKNCLNVRGVVRAGLGYRGIGRIPMDNIFLALPAVEVRHETDELAV